MNEVIFTDAQREAIYSWDCPVLVSAGAGSGKTKVLTQRLIERVLAGEDIDRFLVITFTRAAAAELRSRILQELGKLSAERPEDRRLRRQSDLLYRAQIGTIDSFCAAVVRENAQLLGISPTFSVLEEERGEQMLLRALDEVLDRAYETMGGDPAFRELADGVGAGLDDAALGGAVLSLYRQMQSHAWPRVWAEEKLRMLDAAGAADPGDTVWGAYLLEETAADAASRAERLEAAIARMTDPADETFMEGYRESYARAAELERDIARAARDGWDKLRVVLEGEFPELSRKRKNVDAGLRRQVKPLWDECRTAFIALRPEFERPGEDVLADIARTRPLLEKLTELAFRLEDEYAERKRRADAWDFSDVEHFCVRLLSDTDNGVAARLSARFTEVMVDEYQDVNDVQEQIFRMVSGEGRRLFMVGDVKQSIYRFRLAEPEIFRRKFAEFGQREDALRVDLRENFRSRGAVLDACNAVSRRIMSPAMGDVAYDEHAALLRGADYYPAPEGGEPLPELVLIDRAEVGKADRAMAEPRWVAARIRQMVEAKEPVYDGAGGMRPVEYGDIAILIRTANASGGAYRRALVEAGVPVVAQQGGGFFAQPEIRFCTAMLAVADNPRQDVPLIAAMRGLPFAFTPDELSAVRAADKRADLWDALCLRAEEDEKCARFAAAVRELRDLSREEPTEALLRWLFDRTGLFAACAAMPDGVRRGAALMQLYEYARRFEADGSRGLFRFVAWLRQLAEKGTEPSLDADGSAVRILSIHKSKGLEFPVVFLADTGRQRAEHESGSVRFHSELGMGMRLTDTAAGVSWPTLPLTAIRRRTKHEELSEWERLLYVAMTRARERLILSYAVDEPEDALAALGGPSDGPVPPQVVEAEGNLGKWLLRAAAADGGRTMRVRCIRAGAPEEYACDEAAREKIPAAEADVRALTERLAWRYPAAAAELPSKLTATGLRREVQADDPEAMAMERTPRGARRQRKPELGRTEEKTLTGAERGVAAHLVMQHIDFAKTGTLEDIAGEIARLRERGFLDERQASAVPPEDIAAFFRSDIGRRVLAADRVVREFRFSLLCPAERWFPAAPAGEEILLQGVVDCCIEEGGVLTVIDFKTDRDIEPERHADQVEAYAMAMERVTGMPVAGAALWYLRHRQAVHIPLTDKKIVAIPGKV